MEYVSVIILIFNFFLTANAIAAEDMKYLPIKKGVRFEWDCKSNQEFVINKPDSSDISAKIKEWKEYFSWEAEEIKDGEKWMKAVRMRDIPGVEPTIEYYRQTKDGAFIWSEKGVTQWMKYPLEIGSIHVFAYPSNTFNQKRKVLGKEILYTPRRTYEDCVVFEVTGTNEISKNDWFIKEWRCAGVGLVKSIFKTRDLVQERNLVNVSE